MQGLHKHYGLIVVVAISAVDCAAHSMNSLGPFAVGELVRAERFSIMQAGLWSCVEMLAYAMAMIGIAALSALVRLRFVALIASTGLVRAQAGSALRNDLWHLLSLLLLSRYSLAASTAVVYFGFCRLLMSLSSSSSLLSL